MAKNSLTMSFNLGKQFLSKSVSTRFCSTLVTNKALPLCYLTDAEHITRDSVAAFAKQKVLPLVREMENQGRYNSDLVKDIFTNGMMGIEVPAAYGGTELSFTSNILTLHEISKVDPSLAILIAVHNGLVCNLILKLGTDEQKEKYLPKLASNSIGCFCLSEHSSGSDAFAMKTVAKRDGDNFILNGSKSWISNADIADYFIVFVNADPSKGYRGITCFIVDRDTPGLSVGAKEDKLGMIASNTCSVFFENVKVSSSAILGQLFQGYQYAAGMLNSSRIGIGAQMLGISEACLDIAIPYTLERKQFGQSIFDFQGLQYQIADITSRLELVRWYTYNTARLLEQGLPFAKEAAIVKYTSSELAQLVTRKCIDWVGGVGFTKSYLLEKFYRDCKVGTIYEGTSNMQLSLIAKHLKKQYE